MKKRLSAAQVRDLKDLLNRWDPQRVRPGADGPTDQYDSYLPLIVSFVQGGCSIADLTDHLGDLRTETMRLEPDRAADRVIAEAIFAVAQIREVLH